MKYNNCYSLQVALKLVQNHLLLRAKQLSFTAMTETVLQAICGAMAYQTAWIPAMKSTGCVADKRYRCPLYMLYWVKDTLLQEGETLVTCHSSWKGWRNFDLNQENWRFRVKLWKICFWTWEYLKFEPIVKTKAYNHFCISVVEICV